MPSSPCAAANSTTALRTTGSRVVPLGLHLDVAHSLSKTLRYGEIAFQPNPSFRRARRGAEICRSGVRRQHTSLHEECTTNPYGYPSCAAINRDYDREAAVLRVLDAKAEAYLALVKDEVTLNAYLRLLKGFQRFAPVRLAGSGYADAATTQAQRLTRQIELRAQYWRVCSGSAGILPSCIGYANASAGQVEKWQISEVWSAGWSSTLG